MRKLKRTLTVVAMFVMAINANAYRWQSPYAYCNNNQYTDESGPNKGWEHNIMGNSMNGTLNNRNITDILKTAWDEYDKWIKDGNKGEFKYEINS